MRSTVSFLSGASEGLRQLKPYPMWEDMWPSTIVLQPMARWCPAMAARRLVQHSLTRWEGDKTKRCQRTQQEWITALNTNKCEHHMTVRLLCGSLMTSEVSDVMLSQRKKESGDCWVLSWLCWVNSNQLWTSQYKSDVIQRLEARLASFPGLPRFISSVCVQYKTRKYKGKTMYR